MATKTIAGLFTNASRGEAALNKLKAAGFTSAQISELADDHDAAPTKPSSAFADFFKEHTSSASDFQASLTHGGISAADAQYFEEGIARGGALVTVKADDRAGEAIELLRGAGANLGSTGRTTTTGSSGTLGAAGAYGKAEAAADYQKLQLRAERLAVEKTRVASGTVRIGKRVVSERQSIDVPVSHDELVIERHPVTGGAVGGTIGDSRTIDVPLGRDEVRVAKETYATEEVDVGKRSVAGTERVSDTVRREELVVDGDTTERDGRVR